MDRIENIVSCVGDEDYNSMVDEDYNSIVDLLTSYYSYTFNFNDEIAHHILLPIHVAAKMCDAKDLEFLIGIVNNVNDKSFKYNKEAPIHFALSNSSEPESAEEKIKVLIKAGADVNIRSEPLGFAPLHHAVRYSSLGAVEILIKAGANVNDAENYVRFTPLHYAAAEDRKEIAQLLIQNGANVNAGDNDRYIPLHLAAEKGHDKVAGLLLERGATVNATMSDGCTPLHLAAQCGHSEVVDLLLADPNINVGCIDFKFVSKENADKRKLVQKKVQDGRLFEKVKEAAEKMKNGGELGESLKEELENLLKPESEYGFEPGLNHSPDDSDENTTINIAIRAGGELLQLLYDYAEKNIGVDSEIFERLKYAKENPPPRSSLNDVSIPHNLAQAQALIT